MISPSFFPHLTPRVSFVKSQYQQLVCLFAATFYPFSFLEPRIWFYFPDLNFRISSRMYSKSFEWSKRQHLHQFQPALEFPDFSRLDWYMSTLRFKGRLF